MKLEYHGVREPGQLAAILSRMIDQLRLIIAATLALCLLTGPALRAEPWDDEANEFLRWAGSLAGMYQTADGEHLIVTPHTEFELLSLFWMERGDVRALDSREDGTFLFGYGLYPAAPFAGEIDFRMRSGTVPQKLCLRIEDEAGRCATRLSMVTERIRIDTEDARLAGLLITPPGEGPFPAAVIIPSGFNDRYQHWRLAMALLSRGIGALVYDARLAGESTGEPLPLNYYERSIIRAKDAAAVARRIRPHPRIDGTRTGVIGWSQGGWLGAIVAGADDEVAFHVNIAANLNPGWQQQRHARLMDLKYAGFPDRDVAVATQYFDALFGVMHGSVSWDDYSSRLATVSESEWFRWLEEEGFSVRWETPQEAEQYADIERPNVPARDLAAVHQPALAIYFEFDESSPPDSSLIFVREIANGHLSDVTLVNLPRTTHEAWIVDDYLRKDDPPPTRLAPEVFLETADWIASRCSTRGAPALPTRIRTTLSDPIR